MVSMVKGDDDACGKEVFVENKYPYKCPPEKSLFGRPECITEKQDFTYTVLRSDGVYFVGQRGLRVSPLAYVDRRRGGRGRAFREREREGERERSA